MPQLNHDWLLSRVGELRDDGRHLNEAWRIAGVESLINAWPTAWGDNLVCWLYGSLRISEAVDFPELGIHIENERQLVPPYAHKAIIKVPSKDMQGVLDGIERLEKVLGAWNIVSWGRTIHYYCHFFLSGGGILVSLDTEQRDQISSFLSSISELKPPEQQLLHRAAWWLRYFDRSGIIGEVNPSIFAQYTACWNALEVLTELLNSLYPLNQTTRMEKDQQIAEYFGKLGRSPNVEELAECYRNYVDPGIRKRISHAFDVCFGVVGGQYASECFERTPRERRLYQIRNDINHGNISEYNFSEKLRAEQGLDRLNRIVFNIFLLLGKQSVILDTELNSCFTCVHLDENHSCMKSLLPSNQIYWRYLCQSYLKKGN